VVALVPILRAVVVVMVVAVTGWYAYSGKSGIEHNIIIIIIVE